MSWDSEVDVVVLGSGGAGLTAALAAAAAGASVDGVREGADSRRDHRGVGRHCLDSRP